MSSPIIQTVKLLFLAEQLCVIELDVRRLTKEIRSADCTGRRSPVTAHETERRKADPHVELSGPCWAHEHVDDVERQAGIRALPKEGWCSGCAGGQAAYQQRKKMRARRSGLKRRMVNLYVKATGCEG